MKNFLNTLCACLLCCAAFGQYTVRGLIQGQADNAPLVGANVAIQLTGFATATDIDGRFVLNNVPAGNYTLNVSYVGYHTAHIKIEVAGDVEVPVNLKANLMLPDEVVVTATRASGLAQTTATNVNKQTLERVNLGQDLPILLQQTPSVVVTSDAGAGVGYTGIRIRGSDPSRINVTVNGIPLNDAESQGVFWVNMPDFASSVNNIQIQRGVGSSTNGAGNFGASVNIQTNSFNAEPYAEINNSGGSFSTFKHTVMAGTGLINNRFTVDARLSQITSDGYIDRASANLRSYFVSAGYYGKKTLVKANVFSGKEITYQSWFGTPEARVNNDAAGIEAYIDRNFLSGAAASNLRNSGRNYNFYTYDNQVDDYQQDHYQLHAAHTVNDQLTLNGALHYTYGRGFFEEFREDDDLAAYLLPDITIGNETITSTDLIRRRWLDNDFYGFTFSADYRPSDRWQVILGGAWNQYEGDHFGEVIWARFASTSNIRERYYQGVGDKEDFNLYLKTSYQLNDRLSLFTDLQYRSVNYFAFGTDNDLRAIAIGDNYKFFNPKAGLTYVLDQQNSFYAYYGIANREPVRADFVDAPNGAVPEHETLRNIEIGFKRNTNKYTFALNYYLMDYTDQLVNTGALNDVGSPIRTNVGSSHRAGIEAELIWHLTPQVSWGVNATFSENKIDDFSEVTSDVISGELIVNDFTDTDISFSPNVIAGSQWLFRPIKGLEAALLSRYIGSQFLDNTSNSNRQIDSYFVNDFRVSYTIETKKIKSIGLNLLVNNVFNTQYSANGYTFNYVLNDLIVENFFYPQAGTNFLLGLSIKL